MLCNAFDVLISSFTIVLSKRQNVNCWRFYLLDGYLFYLTTSLLWFHLIFHLLLLLQVFLLALLLLEVLSFSTEFENLLKSLLLSLKINQNLHFWVWGSFKISPIEFEDLSKSPLLLSLETSKILILFIEINTTFRIVFVQVYDSTQI